MADNAGTDASSMEIADDGPMIIATVRLPVSPRQALTAFTDASVLARWWRGELIADLVPGGEYSVSFPAIPARLTGLVLSYTPEQLLEFSWAWEGEEEPPSTVRVTVQPDGNLTVLRIDHGPHEDDEPGRTAHRQHWEGWEYFLPKLPTAVTG